MDGCAWRRMATTPSPPAQLVELLQRAHQLLVPCSPGVCRARARVQLPTPRPGHLRQVRRRAARHGVRNLVHETAAVLAQRAQHGRRIAERARRVRPACAVHAVATRRCGGGALLLLLLLGGGHCCRRLLLEVGVGFEHPLQRVEGFMGLLKSRVLGGTDVRLKVGLLSGSRSTLAYAGRGLHRRSCLLQLAKCRGRVPSSKTTRKTEASAYLAQLRSLLLEPQQLGVEGVAQRHRRQQHVAGLDLVLRVGVEGVSCEAANSILMHSDTCPWAQTG
jgi:hypothetical protein